MICENGAVDARYAAERVLRLVPEVVPGGAMMISELYFASCKPQQRTVRCGVCGVDRSHIAQSRLVTEPNVLLIQVKRSPGLRSPVEVDASLELPGLSVMELVGVVYHAGSSVNTDITCVL